MKFSTRKEEILKPLQIVSGAVERRHTLPILANVLLRLDGDRLNLTATDLEIELKAAFEVTGAANGEATVPARKLVEIVRELPEEQEIRFEHSDRKMNIRCGRYRSHLATLPANEFPAVEGSAITQRLAVNAADLKQLIERTSFSMAQQDVRYFLNGLLIEIDPAGLRMVATDGHRLAWGQIELPGGSQQAQRVILPRKGVMEMVKMLGEASGEVSLAVGGHHLLVEAANFSLLSKLVDGVYPDYERVIPRNGDKTVIASTLELRQALSRTAVLANEKYRGVRASLSEGSLRLSANNPDQEEAEETVSVEYRGDEIDMGFNVAYLQEVLNVIRSESVRITLKDSNSSALVEEPGNPDSLYVVMPMKL